MTVGIFNCLHTGKDAEWTHLYKQVIATLASFFLSFSGGLAIGITAVLLPKLGEDKQFYWKDEYGSWIASMTAVSSIFSCVCIGSLLDRFGRKLAYVIMHFPFIFGWLCMAFANNFYIMLIGRFMTGLSVGAVRTTTATYLGEISDPKYRGVFLLVLSLAFNVGNLLCHIVGSLINWRTTLFICLCPNLSLIMVIFCLKESPYWLISKGRIDEATHCFRWFRGTGELAESELRIMIEKQKTKGTALTRKKLMGVVLSSSFIRPMITLFFVFMIVHFNGVNVFPFYAHKLIQTMFDDQIDTFLVMMITDLIRVGVGIIICLIGKNMHRRATFIYFSYLTGLLLAGLVVVRFYEKEVPDKWIPLTLISIYTGIASIVSSLSWTFVAELFPTNVRGLGSGVTGANCYLLQFLIVKITPDLLSHGEPVFYGTFAVVTLISTIILHFMLPETHGKTLQEIEGNYNNKDRIIVTKL